MIPLDVRIKSLKGTQLMFFMIGNLLVLAANMPLSLVLPVDLHRKLYVLVIHILIFFIFWITTKTAAIKVVFALFSAVFMIYPANVVLDHRFKHYEMALSGRVLYYLHCCVFSYVNDYLSLFQNIF